MPVVFLLLFVYVFGGTLGAGLGVASGGRDAYLAYVVPGILVITVAGAAQGTAISIAMDMTEGIIARFRTMDIARASVLTGHVVGSVIQTMLALAIVVGVAVLIGFRPPRDRSSGSLRPACSSWPRWPSSGCRSPSAWSPGDVETASNLPMILILLPFLSSGFVPDRLDAGRPELVRRAISRSRRSSRPCAASCWARRSATTGVLAVAWCVGISVAGYLWSRRLYERSPARPAG